jgi:hypothetical protein
MKQKLYLILAGFLLVSINLKAQAPFAFNYQGVARNAAGEVLPDQMIALRFTIHQTATGGTIVYQETQLDSTNLFGLFTASLGFGTQTQGDFSTIAWGNGVYFLQVEMDVTGTGSNYLDMGAQQLLSVPYALYAASSGNNSSLTQNQIAYGNSSNVMTSSPNLIYNGNQAIFNLVDSWGGLKVEGRNGGEGSVQIKPDNIADGAAGSWVIGTNGSVMNSPNDWALYNARGIPQPIYVTQATNAVTFDKAYTFPTTDGTSGEVLTTDGAGDLTWTTSSAGDNWGAQVAITDSNITGAVENTLTGDGLPSSPLKLAQQGAITGQALEWNGTTWKPADVGVGGGSSLTQNQIAFGNASNVMTSSSDLTYNGSQAVFDLADSWGGLKVEGRNGCEGSVQIKPDNIADGAAGSWIIGTNGSVMNNPNDWALYNARGIPQPIYVTQATNAVTFDKAYTFPTTDGTIGQVLSTDGSGDLSWAAPSSGDNWGTQVAITDSNETGAVENTITGDGLPSSPLKIAQQGATSGEVLSWNGTTWVPTTATSLSTPAEMLFTPTNGATIDAIVGTNIVNPSANLASLTIQLPSSLTNGQCVEIKFTKAVNALTYSGGTIGALGVDTSSPSSDFRLFYDAGTSTWY